MPDVKTQGWNFLTLAVHQRAREVDLPRSQPWPARHQPPQAEGVLGPHAPRIRPRPP
jgi:hypothetical protein